jgi:hypothetical protein
MNWEELENRLLLTAYSTYDAVAKKLTVITTSGADTVIVSLSAGNTLSVSVNGVNDYNLASASSASVLTLIDVETNGGNDVINLGATSKPILTATTLSGGNGADTITGGAGPDNIFGGAGNDSIDGGLGSDTVSGGADNDTMSYATRTNPVNVNLDLLQNDGEAGELDWVGAGVNDVESVMGGAGNDVLTGSALGNYISGGAGADLIHGMDGSDTLVGGAGGDSIYGDNDADFIFAKDGEFDVIDGGPGTDSAQVDITPAEAPLPAPVVSTAAVRSAPVSSKAPAKSAVVFSTRRVSPRTIRRRGTVANPAVVAAASDPLPADGVENPITPANLPAVLEQLDPYNKGQVLVTRDDAGNVNIGGTNLDDVFSIQSSKTPNTPINIYNNGGLTQFFLNTPVVQINGVDGADSLDVSATGAVFKPDAQQPGAGTIAADSHLITLTTSASQPLASLSFTDVNNLVYVTPQAQDTLSVNVVPGKEPIAVLGGQSGNLPLSPITMNNVQSLVLDTGTNDTAASTDDQITVDGTSGVLPQLTLLPGTGGHDNLQVNGGLLNLANNPNENSGAPAGGPTLTLVTTGQSASVNLHAPLVELLGLNVQAGSVTLLQNGSGVLVTHSLDMGPQSQLDLMDNSMIVDYDVAPGATPFVEAQVKSAFQLGAATHWTGPGITSSLAQGDPSKGIGYGNSSVILGPSGGTFMGVNVDDTATLVTFTLLGDANLDRTVGFADLVQVAQNYGTSGKRWVSGDFDYDGDVGFADLVDVAQNYGASYP